MKRRKRKTLWKKAKERWIWRKQKLVLSIVSHREA